MISDFKNPSALVAYRVGMTVAQLRFMRLASAKSGTFAYRPRTTAILSARGIIERLNGVGAWHLTAAGGDLLRKAQQIALIGVLEW